MQNFSHEDIKKWSGGADFVVRDKAVNEYWCDGGFTPILKNAQVYHGQFETNEELEAFNRHGCIAVKL